MAIETMWKDVPGYEGIYKVGSDGTIKSLARTCKNRGGLRPIPESLLKLSESSSGYLVVQLNNGGRFKTRYVHRIVAEAFLVNNDSKPFVNHIDGIKTNNHVSNLEWVTHQENMDHAKVNNLLRPVSGEDGGSSKLSNHQAEQIRVSYTNGAKVSEMSRAYGVHFNTIYKIIRNERYKQGRR